jgi:hypothetical protein
MCFKGVCCLHLQGNDGLLWHVTPVKVYWCLRGVCCRTQRPDDGSSQHLWNSGKVILNYTDAISHYRPDDGGSRHVWNTCELLTYYTAQPRRLPSSCSPPRKPKIPEQHGCFYLTFELIDLLNCVTQWITTSAYRSHGSGSNIKVKEERRDFKILLVRIKFQTTF